MKMHARVFIYEATYTTLQNVYTFFEFLLNLWVYLHGKFVDFCHACVSNKECGFKQFRNIDKVPMHLTVLLCNEEPSYKDLANLVIWSLASGIPFITFYDHRGVLKKTEAKFREAVDKRKREDDHILWHDGATCKNGIIGNKIHVRTLSVSDGRNSVTDVAKRCSEGETVDQQTVDCCLKNNFGFPDPDLGLYCDNIFNVYGYPPWQIRTTEFINLGTHHNITPQRFLKALFSYTKTEQRLGK